MPTNRWFSSIHLEAAYPAEPVVLDHLTVLLDRLQPAKLDRGENSAIDGTFFLAHLDDRWGDVTVEVERDHASTSSETREVRVGQEQFASRWPQQVAVEVEAILRGRYSITWERWRDRMLWVMVTNDQGQLIRSTRSRWDRLVPDRSREGGRFALDYECVPENR